MSCTSHWLVSILAGLKPCRYTVFLFAFFPNLSLPFSLNLFNSKGRWCKPLFRDRESPLLPACLFHCSVPLVEQVSLSQAILRWLGCRPSFPTMLDLSFLSSFPRFTSIGIP
jgi:hypothetical protein